MSIIVVSPEELRALVLEAVEEALAKRAPANEEPPPEWLDAKGAAKLLGVCARTVGNLVSGPNPQLPSTRVGRLIRIRHRDVAAFLSKGG